MADAFSKAAEEAPSSDPRPRGYVAQRNRLLVFGFAKGKIKATNKAFEDHCVFATTVRDGKLANVREYIYTQVLVRASQRGACRPA